MTTQGNEREIPRPRPRPTPGHLILFLLAVECVLWLSERFQWFAFNAHKGWTVLIAVASVGVAMVVMLAWWVVALIFRWRFQFSIRSLLMLTVAVAVPCSWLAVEMKAAKEQGEVVQVIMKSGGHVERQLLGRLSWWNTWLGIDFFACPGKVTFHSDITDEDLDNLTKLHDVHNLCLWSDQVTDRSLIHIDRLARLGWLTLHDTRITDDGLEHLKRLPELHWLNLRHTPITDSGLRSLREIPRLELLYCGDTRITDDGIKKLQQALPDCMIEW